ncbi:hypothetical protein UZ35_02595 [Heyndrickxia coagulans]|jgi:hypothetical protein|nr:hypothetical protein CIW84_03220 [Heyndrickxia coagulans]AVD57254.1 hypothetical protein C3766_14765 [Heyndrickxia coagulans]KGB29416.1 hypothetical protein IE89_10925 [Heyndrickxia coagulans]KXT21655.1 hypothetical protein UZ35_02595 [Heyndrickxia coagulans]OZV96965.1 hypothetical protein CAY57_04715 [Heyndrickxia coagulans]
MFGSAKNFWAIFMQNAFCLSLKELRLPLLRHAISKKIMMDNFCWCYVVAAWPVMLRKRGQKVLFLNIERVYVKKASENSFVS